MVKKPIELPPSDSSSSESTESEEEETPAKPKLDNSKNEDENSQNEVGNSRKEVEQTMQLIGQTIKITQGPYMSHIGIVEDATETTARVKLQSRRQTISLHRSHIAIVGGPSKNKVEDSLQEAKNSLMEAVNSRKEQASAKVPEQKVREEPASESSSSEEEETGKNSQVAATPASSQSKRKRKRKRRPRNRNKLPKADGDARPSADKTSPLNPNVQPFVSLADKESTTPKPSKDKTAVLASVFASKSKLIPNAKELTPNPTAKPFDPIADKELTTPNPSQNGGVGIAALKLGRRSRDVSCEEALLGAMTASNGARKSSKSSPSTPRNGYPTPNLGPTTPTRTLSGNSATPPNGYPGPNLGRPTPTRPLSGNPPAAGGGFDKLLGLATRGTPIVGSRSNNIGSQVLRNPSNPNGPENLGKGDEVPAPNYDALPALRGIPAVGSEIAFKVGLLIWSKVKMFTSKLMFTALFQKN